MPKWGAGEVYEQNLPADLGSEGAARQGGSLTKGQILWLRGITRLQTQVSFIRYSHSCIDDKTTHDTHTSLVWVFVLLINPEDNEFENARASMHVCMRRESKGESHIMKKKETNSSFVELTSAHTHILISFSIHLIIVLYNQSDRCKSLKLSKNMLPNRRLPNGNHHHTFSHSFIHISTPT